MDIFKIVYVQYLYYLLIQFIIYDKYIFILNMIHTTHDISQFFFKLFFNVVIE